MMEHTMRALVHYEAFPGAVELRDVPIPQPEHDQVLLRVRGVGICGSDLHQFRGTQSWPVSCPVILGHEFCGEIAALGTDVKGWMVSDRVTCETAAYICGTCAMCRSGRYNLCPKRLGFGYGIDGAAAEYVVVRSALLHRLPESLSWTEAALVEPCCVAVNVVLEQSRPKPGDTAVVFGPGPIGLLCTSLLAATGPSHLVVIGLERDQARLQIAREYGATRTMISDGEEIIDAIRDVGDGLGFDLVIDAAGISSTLDMALEIVRPAGQITKVGWGPDPLDFTLDRLVAKAVTLRGSFSHTWTIWERTLRLLHARTLDVRPLANSYSLAQWRQAFADMESGKIAKAVLVP